MMLPWLARAILDCLIAAAALWTIWHSALYLWAITHLRPERQVDLAQVQVWDVLAEARRITETAVRDAAE